MTRLMVSTKNLEASKAEYLAISWVFNCALIVLSNATLSLAIVKITSLAFSESDITNPIPVFLTNFANSLVSGPKTSTGFPSYI